MLWLMQGVMEDNNEEDVLLERMQDEVKDDVG